MKSGRPRKSEEQKQTEVIPVRASRVEKLAFQQCADLAGISLSAWVRERLRLSAIRELESAGRPVPFIEDVPLGENE